MIWALVPAKTLEHAKTRLASLLDAEERRTLSLAMLQDVLRTLLSARSIDRVAVVTEDALVAGTASTLGAEVFAEARSGQNEALEDALARCRALGADAALIVSSDLPLLRPATVECLVARAMQKSAPQAVLLAPSRDGTGTNALLQRPPGILPLLFGPESLRRHQQAALEQHIPAELVRAPDLALDIDTPADLLEFVRLAGQSQTRTVITQLQLLSRILERFYGGAPVY